MSTNKKKVRWIKHYNSAQKILLVGEGDFSFSACLAKAFGSGRNMVATSLHSERLQVQKHWSSEEHLEKLERLGCLVLQKVDVYEMSYHHTLKHMKFDVIVFNFPHAGHFYGYTETDEELIEMHKELLRGFFKSAREMLVKEGAEVHVTQRNDYPYNTWELENIAKESGFNLKEKVRLEKGDYPGYHNKRGGDIDCNRTFPITFECFTFKFSLHMENTGNLLQKNNEHEHETNERASQWPDFEGGFSSTGHSQVPTLDQKPKASGDMGLENTGDDHLQENNDDHDHEINERATGDMGLRGIIAAVGMIFVLVCGNKLIRHMCRK
ncbi:hypothetical protein Vadar_017234 [Vaccinium darrowii]|uniref:Uncharacterized protein n=1 Tax=Vaccinium darrowii TaxID=229202 RepID=A0ACB7Z499_9ERIC|nr:hypothetical protein Vadar_017234 [Vaccinium darrowii]